MRGVKRWERIEMYRKRNEQSEIKEQKGGEKSKRGRQEHRSGEKRPKGERWTRATDGTCCVV